MNTLAQISAPFNGAELLIVEYSNQPYTAMRPIVEGMGLDWKAQSVKIKQRFNSVVGEITTTGKDGKQYQMLCLPLKKLFGWLMTISPNKVKPELRDTVIKYQAECDDVLWDYWTKGQAINQRQMDTRVKINVQQQTELKEIVDRRCEGSVKKRTELWSRHNQHFRIPRYSELLAIHFQDAVNYLETMQIKAKGSIHIDENQSIEMLCVYSKFFQAWWDTHSPTLAKLNPLLVSMLHDGMFSMTYAISDICKKHSIVLPEYDYKHMFELKTLPHQRYKLLK